MEPTYRVVGEPGTKPVGLCGSGIIDMISELFMTGIINRSKLSVKVSVSAMTIMEWAAM